MRVQPAPRLVGPQSLFSAFDAHGTRNLNGYKEEGGRCGNPRICEFNYCTVMDAWDGLGATAMRRCARPLVAVVVLLVLASAPGCVEAQNPVLVRPHCAINGPP